MPSAVAGCPLSQWILKTDFERDFRAAGLASWQCASGHANTVLPSQTEVTCQARRPWASADSLRSPCLRGVRSGVRSAPLPLSWRREQVDEMNRNLLTHPEFYTQSCYYDSQV